MITLGMIGAGIGASLMQCLLVYYYDKKRDRKEITLVEDSKGRLVDSAIIFERKMIRWYCVAVVAVIVSGMAVLFSF